MLSIVIPVYNEADSLEVLHGELDRVAAAEGYQIEIFFVNDGSTDNSWQVICDLAQRDPRVRGIRFRRNFGKAAALSAGFKAARGDVVFTLDADLQDDPKEIPHFLEEIERDVDVVSGWKKIRHDPWHKVFPSRIFNWLVSRLTGVKLHDHNCGFKCYRREVFKEVRLYGELHRFVPVLAAARGFRVSEIVIEHRARKFGRSKYGAWRFVKGFLDLLSVKFVTGFGQSPQHALGSLGLLFFFFGLLLLLYLAGRWSVSRLLPGIEDFNIHATALIFYAIALLLLGGQFISIGFVAELMTAYHSREMSHFSVAETVGSGDLPASVGDATTGEELPASPLPEIDPADEPAPNHESPASELR